MPRSVRQVGGPSVRASFVSPREAMRHAGVGEKIRWSRLGIGSASDRVRGSVAGRRRRCLL